MITQQRIFSVMTWAVFLKLDMLLFRHYWSKGPGLVLKFILGLWEMSICAQIWVRIFRFKNFWLEEFLETF